MNFTPKIMRARRFFTIPLFLLFSSSLFGEESISGLLEHWLAVESALYNWQGSPADTGASDEAENLFSSLEQFNKILEEFTGSLLFLQYEGTGLLPEGSGRTACRMTKELIASVKIIVIAENSGAPAVQNSLAIKTDLARKADAIRKELYSWSSMDSQISSNVFLRSIYLFGVFSFCVIGQDFSADRLSPQMQLQIYRVVQEALSNIEKHSEAKEVTLTARNKEDKALLICVTDDGKGLHRSKTNTQSRDGLGIRGMYQRALILGASLSFVEGAGYGLTARLEVPLPK